MMFPSSELPKNSPHIGVASLVVSTTGVLT